MYSAGELALERNPECTATVHALSPLRRLIEYPHAIAPQTIGDFLAVLLKSGIPECDGGCQALRPLWAEEAMNRADNLLRLALMLAQRVPRGSCKLFVSPVEFALADELAALYRSLEVEQERRVVPCSAVLRGVVRNLVALFGSAVSAVELRTQIELVALPAYRRRALVMAASELVINALRHAFKGRRHGWLFVELRAIDRCHAQLSVTDNGVGCSLDAAEAARGVAGGLAGLLGSELIYRPGQRDGTTAEIAFSLNI
jgi:signal transduction histidine kinase